MDLLGCVHPPSPGQRGCRGVLFFMIKQKIIRDKMRYSNLSNNILFFYFILLDLPTRAGSPQQHKPITVGPFYLTHPVNFPCGRKPEYPGKTHDFGRALTFYSFHMRTGFESH